MGSIYKEFSIGHIPNNVKTGVAAISGQIVRKVDDNIIKVGVEFYDHQTKSVMKQGYDVDLSAVGGVQEDMVPGNTLTAIGDIDHLEGTLKAAHASLGSCLMTYKKFGIVAGEAKYTHKKFKTGKDYTEVQIPSKEGGKDVYNVFKFMNTKTQTNQIETLDSNLRRNCPKDFQLTDDVLKDLRFESVLTFKDHQGEKEEDGQDMVSVKEFEKTNGEKAYMRYFDTFAPYKLNRFTIGAPDMERFNERQQAAQEYQQYKEEHADVKEDTSEDKSDGNDFVDMPEGGETLPFELDEPDYRE